jgi:TP901 family phage tail tape measure protein
MATSFSVSVAIGGKLLPSLAGAVNAAKTQVKGLEASLAGIGARTANTFAAVNKHLAASQKRMANVQRAGSRMTMGITMPVGFTVASGFKKALEWDRSGNVLQSLGGASSNERREAEAFAQSVASQFGSANEVLKTFNSLLRAGYSLPAAKGAIPSIMSGSIVSDGEMQPAQLGDSVSKLAIQFGLPMSSVEEAGATTRRVTDNLIYGANKTVASLGDMVQSYRYVGAAAAAAGESVESTNAMIIALSQAGHLNSEAGVALRSAYVSLLKPTKQGRTAMANLGLDYGKYIAGGKIDGAGVARGLGASGFQVPAKVLDEALAGNAGNVEKQKQAVTAAVAAHVGAERASDIEALNKAVDDAFTLSGSRIDLPGLLGDLKKVGAGQSHLARIFQGRQSVRLLSLLAASLPDILADVNANAPGGTERAFDMRQQGLEGAVRRMTAAWETFNTTLLGVAKSEIVGVMEGLAGAVKSLAATSPGLLRTGLALTGIAAAAGPLAFVLGGIGRLAATAFGGVVASAALMTAGITRALTGIGAAAVLATTRIRAFAAGAMVLGAVGGRGAVFAAMGASLASFGRAVLLFPIVALRAIGVAMWALVANPVGLAITATVAALAALGVWVYNNASGIAEFFKTFAGVFLEGTGGANGPLGTMVGYLKDAATWVGNLLGPLDESGDRWRSWGASVGIAAADGVNKIVGAIQSVVGWINTLIEAATKAGNAIAGIFRSSPTAGARSPFVSNSIAGARAAGGPVTRGLSYLVGEKGPEIWTPGASGQITSNERLRRLTADGAAAVAGSTSTTTSTHGPVTLSPTFIINGADNPAAVERQIENYMSRLQSEYSGMLSD